MKNNITLNRVTRFLNTKNAKTVFGDVVITDESSLEEIQSFLQKMNDLKLRFNDVSVYNLIKTHLPGKNLYECYLQLKKTKPHTLDNYKMLYGVEVGEFKFKNRSSSLSKSISHSPEKRILKFLQRHDVKSRGIQMPLDSDIMNDLVVLFSDFDGPDISIVIDLISHGNGDILKRYEAVKKFSHHSLEYSVARYGDDSRYHTKKQAYREIAKKNFSNTVEYWTHRGFTEDDAKKQQSVEQSKRGFIANKGKEGVPRCRSIEFWLNQGKSLGESTAIVKAMQSRGLDYYLAKHGEDIGLVKFNEMISKRNTVWLEKSADEKLTINKSKGRTFSELIDLYGVEKANEILSKRMSSFAGVSKESCDFFKALDGCLPKEISETSQTAYKGQERWVIYDGKLFFIDYLVKNTIIEYNGSFWHADPRSFNEDDYHSVINKSAKEIWENDNRRIEILKSMGYRVLVIWSLDVADDPQKEIEKCRKFINEHNT
jgi:hypothetical protein